MKKSSSKKRGKVDKLSIGKIIKKKVSKGLKGVVKGAKVAKAGAGLAALAANPVNQAKFLVKGARGKGWTLPGSKYIGPGNEMNLGTPTSSADAAAYRHDLAYDKYLKSGKSKKKVYLGYSDADARLMKESDVTTKEGLATYLGMLPKKGMYKLGLTGKRIKG